MINNLFEHNLVKCLLKCICHWEHYSLSLINSIQNINTFLSMKWFSWYLFQHYFVQCFTEMHFLRENIFSIENVLKKVTRFSIYYT